MSQMSTGERLAYMANQIAAKFAVAGELKAAQATADHIATFWDPRMKARILERYRREDAHLSTIAAAAIAILLTPGAPAHQSGATKIGKGEADAPSDAGLPLAIAFSRV